jgi:steroid 5-alpha reductase family enzyme
MNKSKWFQCTAWVFFITVCAHAVYRAHTYHHWWGLVILIVGFAMGTLYDKVLRKFKNDK